MGRAPCCEKHGLKKGPWTTDEDEKLIDYIHKNGCGNWRTLPKNAGLQRCGKSCRLRWTNYLRPDIKRGRFSFEEEETIIQLHSILGNKWSAIAARLPGRTDNEIKNYWNTHIRKKLLRMGIDPVTHRPRIDLLHLSTVLNPSLYGNSQIDLDSRLLGLQNLINPQMFILPNSDHILPQNQLIHRDNLFLPQLIQTGPNMNQADPQLIQYDDVCHFPKTLDYGSALPNVTELGYVAAAEADYGGQQPGQPPSSPETLNNNFGCKSVVSNMSTASGGATPMHSNSTYNVEDEKESYSSSMLEFEIPDILDVSDFM